MSYLCVCGATTTRKNWCYEGKHQRRSPKPKHVTCTRCPNPSRSHGLCEMHYKRAYRAGLIPTKTPVVITPTSIPADDKEDLWAFVQAELAKRAA